MNTIAADLRNHLPYARRFARALCGNQESGDAYVAQTLETMIADRSIFDRYSTPRAALYATFLRLWNAVAINLESDAVDADPAVASADRNLQAMAPVSRQAFLLVSLEGFAPSDVAEILGVDVDEVNDLLGQATRDIADQISTDVLIIEDEPLVAMDIEATMQDLGHNVVGVATTHDEAVELAKQKRPNLVLADIQLADGSSGIDAVKEMLAGFDATIVFITAFPERLLTGEKPEPAFLITKPFDVNVVKAITSQALFFGQKVGKTGAAA